MVVQLRGKVYALRELSGADDAVTADALLRLVPAWIEKQAAAARAGGAAGQLRTRALAAPRQAPVRPGAAEFAAAVGAAVSARRGGSTARPQSAQPSLRFKGGAMTAR